VDSDGTRLRIVACGALASPSRATLPERLHRIHEGLARLLDTHHPDAVAIESLFYARNARSALVLGHARGVAVLAAVEAGLPIAEYTPAAIKLAVVGYGRAEKAQMQAMVKLLLGLAAVPTPHDAADALAVAICHAHSTSGAASGRARRSPLRGRSWRDYQPPPALRRQAP
jgi:crossover junction endodeoxyribonuclease RuvC